MKKSDKRRLISAFKVISLPKRDKISKEFSAQIKADHNLKCEYVYELLNYAEQSAGGVTVFKDDLGQFWRLKKLDKDDPLF